ncbi:gliding motility-associated ABC transporter ATP-binding subunit GldA [Roseivirga sp. BDSF3-8]|uniref:gliding motility-associated ABC transporter ATP-binding subunit GldA n=1 Tax=Roseivirga sp. BDSF3-8 TaxID=3241598 RepID=UPI00353225C2
MSVSVRQLTKTYGSQQAVDTISFEVNKGEVLGFLGPNGAGKSTTMKIATCYLPPTAGTVLVEGHDVLHQPMAVRKSVGYLPEHNPLYLDMYVHEYLRFTGSLYDMRGSVLRQRVKDMVHTVGLGLEQNKKIGALSKGYRQRVGLAQALLHDPPVLILDEPTTGLDPNQLAEIRGLIKSLSSDKTVIFSTHIMQEVQAMCDRVIIINRGQIVADSPVAALSGRAAGQRLLVEFTEPVADTVIETAPGVAGSKQVGPNLYELHAAKERADIRADVFRWAVGAGLIIVGMQEQKSDLESIFQELTGAHMVPKNAEAS